MRACLHTIQVKPLIVQSIAQQPRDGEGIAQVTQLAVVESLHICSSLESMKMFRYTFLFNPRR